MKKIVAGFVASALLASSLPALAGPYGYSRHYDYGPPAARHHHHRGWGGAPLAWGIAGLALGSVLYAIATPPAVAAPVPAPVVTVPPPAPAGQTWYYCEPYQAYYPNVQTCPEAWRPVPAY
jgi:hypothetical protein